MAAVRNHFKPEFLNRIDEIVVFHRLDEAHIERIVDIQVEQLRGAAGRARPRPRAHRRGARAHRRASATTPTSGPGRSSGCSSARSATRSRSRCSRASTSDGDIVVVDASPDGELTFSGQQPVTV